MAVGIIAEFNPFHNGHKKIVDIAKQNSDCVVAVMSGNYVQRGTPAFFNKFIRAEAALKNGVDLIVELPSPWSSSFAQNFSFGSISLLKNLYLDKLIFGTENADIKKLSEIANADQKLKLNSFIGTFANARQNALKEELGDSADLLTGANNNLAIEYIKACKNLGYSPELIAVNREYVIHDSKNISKNICSASYLRENILTDSSLYNYLPENCAEIYKIAITEGIYLSEEKFSNAIVEYLRRINNFRDLPELSEGIENRLKKAISTSQNYTQLTDEIKTKRYTLARVRRLILSAFLNQSNYWVLKEVPYLNILGFSKAGEKYLKSIAKSLVLPIIISNKPNVTLNKQTETLLNSETTRNDVYMSLLRSALPCGSDYTHGIIKKGD